MSEKVSQLQLLQQNMQHLQVQKQQMEGQLTELSSALSEIKDCTKAYKILGKIMVAASQEGLQKELVEKKEIFDLRLQNLVKQEKKLQSKMDVLQKEVLQELQQKK